MSIMILCSNYNDMDRFVIKLTKNQMTTIIPVREKNLFHPDIIGLNGIIAL